MLADRPEPQRLVRASRDDDLAIGGEGHAPSRFILLAQERQRPIDDHVPEPHRPVEARRGEGLAVGRERQALDARLVPLERAQGAGSATSQSRIVVSGLPDATVLPSGANARAVTAPE